MHGKELKKNCALLFLIYFQRGAYIKMEIQNIVIKIEIKYFINKIKIK